MWRLMGAVCVEMCMVSLHNFYIIFIGCVLIAFLFTAPVLINLLIVCELLWVGFYNIIIYSGIEFATLTYLAYGLLILCLATSESVVGLVLIMLKFVLVGFIKFKTKNIQLKNLAYSNFVA